MQDNEFDKVFNTKFADFEVEPSPMVWDNIAGELDGKKRKRSWVPYLSIAASILVLIASGMLFFRAADKPTKKHTDNKVAVNVQPVVAANTPASLIAEPNTIDQKADKNVPVAHQTTATVSVPSVNIAKVPVNNNTDETTNITGSAKPAEQSLIAAIEEPKHIDLKLTAPDNATELVPKGMAVDPKIIDKPVLAATKPEAPATKKRGIHNMGGLINALVAKVDKREDKLIHFSDSDDDDTGTVLTEVNLGIVTIKKQ